MKEIIKIGHVRGFIDSDGTAKLNAEDVARGWGFTQEKSGKSYVKWERVNGYLADFGFSPLVGKDDYLPENMVYRLGFKASNEAAQKFQAELADNVLPTLRKTGSYTMPKMSKELQAIVMLDGKQEKLREEFEDFKGEIPLFTTECKEIQGIVRKVGVSALGGKKAPAYQNRSLRSRIYGDIQRELKRQFDVRRYESIHRSQFPIARDIVKNYVVPVALRSEIAKENAQA